MSEKNNKDMWTSVSAITDADDCTRRWWFSKKVKLPQPQRQATIFGDVFHVVQERYYKATDTGLDIKTGKPVDIYPKGWMTMKPKFGKDNTLYTITDVEAALIKRLVDKAIAEGVMVRKPGRIVELSFKTPIYSQGFAKAILVGFVDIDNPNEIVDHKTAKSTTYILSKAKLKKSIQMMGYAMEKIISGYRGNLWLTHNNYIKDFDRPQVIQRSVEVTEMEVREFFNNKILPIVRIMLDYHIRYPKTKIASWRDIPGANNPNQSCNFHYGKPCPYIAICSGMCSIDQYLIEYGTTVNELIGVLDTPQKGREKMKLLERIKKNNAEVGAVAPTENTPVVSGAVQETAVQETAVQETAVQEAVTVQETAVQEAVTVQETAEPTTSQSKGGLSAMLANAKKFMGGKDKADLNITADAGNAVATFGEGAGLKQEAPWYTAYNGQECIACANNSIPGYNENMQPCHICNVRSREAGNPTSEDYKVTTLDNGTLQFELLKWEGTEKTSSVEVVKEPEIKTEMHPAVKTEKPLPKIPEKDIPSMPKVKLPKAETKVEDATRVIHAVGFDLLIGCTYASNVNGSQIIYADDILKGILEDIEKAAGKDASAIEHFALMQAIDSLIPAMIKELDGCTIISLPVSKGSAHARLIDGLRLHAKTIIFPFAV